MQLIKIKILLLGLLINLKVGYSQNLVPNPSLEITDSICSYDDIREAYPWFGVISPDIFNTDYYIDYCGLPAPNGGGGIWGGYQFPRTGKCFSGFGFY